VTDDALIAGRRSTPWTIVPWLDDWLLGRAIASAAATSQSFAAGGRCLGCHERCGASCDAGGLETPRFRWLSHDGNRRAAMARPRGQRTIRIDWNICCLIRHYGMPTTECQEIRHFQADATGRPTATRS